ncbi:MAG: hypothetical protein IJD52_00975 [Alphaproteobacteria bacterium]|nr:hypothetical protein [Alphaproteobacteria bacterium]
MHVKKIWLMIAVMSMIGTCGTTDALAAAKKNAGKQAAIQKGTTVRAKVEAKGLYDQECYDAYYGCMDQFCISDNESGGSCACSDAIVGYEKQLAEIQDILVEAERISTVEVEKIEAGAQADIIFNGERKYDSDGNLLGVDEESEEDSKKKKREAMMAMWAGEDEEEVEDFWGSSEGNISEKIGNELYKAADGLCVDQMDEACAGDIPFLRQVYSRQITSDCKGLENSIAQKKAQADATMAEAEAAVRSALKDSFNEANEYDRGTCMVEYKKCMQTQDACGKDWANCVSVIADANLQGLSEAKVFDDSKVNNAVQNAIDADAYGIAASTLDIMDSKRYICEKVLNKCIAVRDMVWSDFLREAAPTIKLAEQKAESKMRQSCLTEVSSCIQSACRDDIEGKGVATMDACLARPDMARSFCKIEIERCERMEPLIWTYVTDKLKAMRVDACTEEVKECFTAETRCGANFQNCIGMDYDYIHDICPIDTLVVCKADKPNFSMDDLDSMLMGLYLNIDNSALDRCQELVDERMTEICGSTTDCNRFAADDVIGTASLRSQKDGATYRITGMISFGSIKMGDASGSVYDMVNGKKVKLEPGQIAVQEYIEQVREKNAGVPGADGIIASIEEELNNIAGTINRAVEMIEQDPEIQFCVQGRDLSQITGKKNDKTEARFPNLLNDVKIQIAVAALRKAQENYNAKWSTEVAAATKDASADLAQYMCQKIAENAGEATSNDKESKTKLSTPYAISYDIGTGLDVSDLKTGGHGTYENYASNGSGISKDVTSVFSRATRNCHVCTTVSSRSCSYKGGGWFSRKKSSCTTETKDPVCEDIQM